MQAEAAAAAGPAPATAVRAARSQAAAAAVTARWATAVRGQAGFSPGRLRRDQGGSPMAPIL